MLGLYTSAALREHGFNTVYCSGTRLARSKFIDRFGAIPLYNGKYIPFFHIPLIHMISPCFQNRFYLHVFIILSFFI
jgi:hypothetical protein